VVVGGCGHGHEPFGFIKSREFLGQLSYYQLLRNSSYMQLVKGMGCEGAYLIRYCDTIIIGAARIFFKGGGAESVLTNPSLRNLRIFFMDQSRVVGLQIETQI
jgi:hypothetical protein